MGLVLTGDRTGRHWRSGKAAPADAYDAKTEALAILAAAGAPVDNLQVLDGASSVYHPGQSGRLCLGPKNALAEFGALHPRIARKFDLDGPVVAAEIFLDAIPQKRGGVGHMRSAYAPPPLQAVTRDFAFLVPAELTADQLLRAVRGADKAAITEAGSVRCVHRPRRSGRPQVDCDRGRASARSEELHRGGAEGDLGPRSSPPRRNWARALRA